MTTMTVSVARKDRESLPRWKVAARVSVEKFLEGLSVAARFAAGKSSVVIIQNVLVQTIPGFIVMRSTNFNISAVVRVPAQVECEIGITVPAGLVSALLSGQKGELTLETTGDFAAGWRLRHAYGEDIVKGFPAEDFPFGYVGESSRTLPGVQLHESLRTMRVPAHFWSAVRSVLPFVTENQSLSTYTNIAMFMDGNTIRVAATDGYVAAEYAGIECEEASGSFGQILVPGSFMTVAAGLFAGVGLTIGVARSAADDEENTILFSLTMPGDITVDCMTNLYSGRYPDYRSVIPTYEGSGVRAMVSAGDLYAAVNAAHRYVNPPYRVNLSCTETEGVTLWTDETDLGICRRELDCLEASGVLMQVAASTKYLARALASVVSVLGFANVRVGFNGDKHAILFTPQGSDKFKAAVMPMSVAVPVRVGDDAHDFVDLPVLEGDDE